MALFFGEPIAPTFRAVVVEIDGDPLALIGLADDKGMRYFFSEERPGMEAHRKRMATLRAIKRVMEWVEESTVPVLSVSDNEELMGRLGFKQLEPGIYKWN